MKFKPRFKVGDVVFMPTIWKVDSYGVIGFVVAMSEKIYVVQLTDAHPFAIGRIVPLFADQVHEPNGLDRTFNEIA